MAGIEFDRQAFIPSTAVQPRSPLHLMVPILAALGLALVAFVGYKVFLVKVQSNEAAAANTEIIQLEQQVGELQKRIDTLEKHRKPPQVDPSPAEPPKEVVPTSAQHTKTVYRVSAASVQPAQAKPVDPPSRPVPVAPSGATSQEIAGEVAANHEAWEATTNRLADVVGVVGNQQGEISATRDALNQILAQSHRQAVSFEVDRHNDPVPVGPVTLQFKSADSKGQSYTLCVFFNSQKCIELRDRALNEVVVFVVAKNQPPLELVATKIKRDQIVGYLEIPTPAP